jgi:hypothetical protein
LDTKFKEGNEIGAETRFKAGNQVSSKYKSEYCEELLEFFRVPEAEEKWSRSYYESGAIKSEAPIILPPKLPTFELFAAKIGVTVGTLEHWCEKYPRFATIYAHAKEIQKGIIILNAMTKQYDANFAKFLLANNHGMKEAREKDTSIALDVTFDDVIDEECN